MKLIGSSTLIIPSEWKCLVRDECLTACDFSSFFFKCNANTNMKTFTAFVLLGLVAISLAARPHAEFAQFIRKYNKVYNSRDEFTQRFQIFSVRNLLCIYALIWTGIHFLYWIVANSL